MINEAEPSGANPVKPNDDDGSAVSSDSEDPLARGIVEENSAGASLGGTSAEVVVLEIRFVSGPTGNELDVAAVVTSPPGRNVPSAAKAKEEELGSWLSASPM